MSRQQARAVTNPRATPFEVPVAYRDLVWYLRSERWQKTRKAALVQTRYRCQSCGLPTKRVVHRHYRTVGFERFEDLRVECGRCSKAHL